MLKGVEIGAQLAGEQAAQEVAEQRAQLCELEDELQWQRDALEEEREVARQAAARKGRSLAVGSWSNPQQCEALCRELGFHAEVLFTSFDRFLLAARPRPDADGEAQRRLDFEAWRDEKVDTLSERIRLSKESP